MPPFSFTSPIARLYAFFALVLLLPTSLQAQPSGNIVISTNTTWAKGTYALSSLTVTGGATLTIMGSSTVNVTGNVLVTANSNLVFGGDLTGGGNAQYGGYLNAKQIEVDAGSTLNADGQGGGPMMGNGAGAAGTTIGGSYGGFGGGAVNTINYCAPSQPQQLGSGGGQNGGVAGAGGGALEIYTSNIILNGIMSANGGAATGAAGAGSGGALYIATNSLNGTGTFAANGGSNTTGNGSGGGGGCALILTGDGTSGGTTSTASGGTGSGSGLAGGAGLILFEVNGFTDPVFINKNVILPPGLQIDFAALRVAAGVTLTVSSGDLVTVNGLLVPADAKVVSAMGSPGFAPAIINAGSVEIDAGGSINADQQGYTAGSGPGAGTGSQGGTYGGAGGGNPSAVYGSASAPVSFGSGGGTYESIGGTGGGVVELNVSETLTNNGSITAEGGTYIVCTGSGACGGGFAGGGSGGSVYVTAGTLTGSGPFNADGGPNASGGGNGGGGGRVAVYYGNASGYTGFLTSTANGGAVTGNNTAGQPGTVGFYNTSAAGNGLTVDDDFTIPPGTTATYTSITVQNGGTLTVGGGSTLNVTGAVLVTGNSNIVLQGANTSAQVNGAWAGVGSTINAGSVEVDAGSTINADAQGYTATNGPGGAASGNTLGGSYGGAGGGQAVGTTYGSATAPLDLGSGGGSYESTGGTGGGAVRIVASGTVLNNGIISANGGTFVVCSGNGACDGGFAGAGAGGSVSVTAASLMGSGSFHADGGTNASSYGSGGGGGRVAVYYNGAQSSFSGFASSTASGGVVPTNNGAVSGSNGTIAFFDTSATNSNVSVYQNYVIPASTSVQYNSLTVAQGAKVTIGGGSTVTVAQLLHDSGTILAQSINNTAQLNGAWQGKGVTIAAGSLQVDANASLNADGQGYAALEGPGAGASGTGNGGSYGGPGGGQAATTVYGSNTAPTDLGSGGGQYQGNTTPGGGAIALSVTGTLTNNGIISANAAPVSGFIGGSSGGSLYVTTGTLAGSGTFNANGGANTSSYGNGGGGGRVAVYYNGTQSSFTGFSSSTASGGGVPSNNGAVSGSNGTIAFFDTSAPNNNVSVYQNYAIPASTTVQYNSLTVANGANVSVGGGSQVLVTGTLHVTGEMVLQSINNTGLVNGTYQGRGVKIVAGTATIDTSGSLIADGFGYGPQLGPGAGASGTGNGGGYGGAGGGATATYGSATNPIDLGSGGGQYQGTAGAGGGSIQMLVAGTLTDNGLISANGVSVSGFIGGGSGGSINLAANTIAGTGTITANGGGNSSPYGNGGGGGRIAITYLTNSGFPQASATANGGTTPAGGDPAGSNGTVTFVNAPVSAWIEPAAPVIHGTTTLEWFTDQGGLTTVTLAGPQTATIANGSGPFSNSAFDTTQFPDGTYQLVLSVLNNAGQVVQTVTQSEVINNSVQWHSGTLTANQTWGPTPVQALDGTVIVPAGVTLTILPGTIVKALPGAEIIVQSGGTLIANGTSSSQVIFTTFDDYTSGGNTDFNQGVTVPSPGEWDGVIALSGGTFTDNTNTILRYVATTLGGTLGASSTLYATQVYSVTGTLTVPSGVTLTLQPGSIIKFGPGAGMDVQPGATLIANGTLAQPIYFTSANDISIGGDTNNTGGTVAPAPGDWNSVILDGATVSLQHVQMQYGGGPVNSGSQAGMLETTDNANVTISDSTFAYSFFVGIQTGYPNGGGDTVTVTDSVFYGNEDRAINAYPGSIVHVVNDTFDGNASGVFAHGGTVDIENSVISNSVGTQFGSVAICCSGTISSFSNNDVYTTATGVTNYVGLTDPTGTLGNISANPVYMNQALHDYRPTFGSPLIDAANGTIPNYPLTDNFGLTRYNDPLVTTKTGKADVNGNYPDIGAFEFVQTAPSDIDFTVSNVSGPTSATAGNQVTVNWTVTNIGSGTAYGPWHDAVYLVTDPSTNPVQTYAGTFLEGSGIVLGPGASFNGTALVTVPGITVGTHRWEVVTNVLGEIFEGANTANNTGVALNEVTTDQTQLVQGGTALSGSFAGVGQSYYYKVIPSATQATKVQLALNSGTTGSVQLFVGGGYVPSPQQFDLEQVEFNSTSASVVIPAGSTQTYYVTAYAQSLSAAPAPFTIQASNVSFSLTSVSPNSSPNSGSATVTFVGGGFTSASTFALVNSKGTVYSPTAVYLADSDHADLTFNLTQIPTGSYSAQVTNGSTITLASAFLVTQFGLGYTINPANGNAFVNAYLETPEAFRAGFPSVVTLHYQNSGAADIDAPLIFVYANNATLTEIAPLCSTCSVNEAQQVGATFNSGIVLGINQQGPAGVLPAGASGAIQFLATPATSGTSTFYTATGGPPIDAYAWVNNVVDGCTAGPVICSTPTQLGSYPSATNFCENLIPSGSSSLGFTRACMLMLNRAGFTFGFNLAGNGSITAATLSQQLEGLLTFQQFNQLLANDATELSSRGDYEYDVQKLIGYELQKDGLQQFNSRYHMGAFGFGPSDVFDVQFSGISGALTFPDGSSQTFPTVSPTNPNVYLGEPGDYSTLAVNTDNTYTVTEPNGILYHFPAVGGGTDWIQDRNGNKLTLTYAAASNGAQELTTVTDVLGNTNKFQYDTTGHITQFTDAAGRITTYTYDYTTSAPNNYPITTYAFLTSITSAQGTTKLVWNEGGSNVVGYIDDSCITTYCSAAIGVQSVTYPDGTHNYYTYDAAGRLTNIQGDLGANSETFTYNSDGSIVTTDGLNHSSTVAPNVYGQPVSLSDPLGNVLQYRYDPENKLIALVNPLGGETLLGYDGMGNPNSVQSPGGKLTSFSFTGDQNLLSLTDPEGATYGFGYDSFFNQTSQVDPSGRTTTFTYDTYGEPLTSTNRRGQTTTYTWANGLLSSMTLSTGATTTYAYDGHYNLLSVTSPSGTARYTYNAADQLTGVSNPDGTSLTYTYNAGGQRISMTDSVGYVTNYLYDAAGRLSKLTDGSNNAIVSYAYDAAGNLSTKTFGNGTSTSYTLDADGHRTSVIHRNAANAVLSEYDYTYDATSNPVTEKTPATQFSLSYDADEQLLSASAGATTLQYTYDLNGNRTVVIANGSSTAYTPNNLNEYAAVGGSAYTYDLDGNVLSGNGYNYTYDENNHMLTAVSATDSWSFVYDAFGNRTASTHNGVTTRYLNDPSGYGFVDATLTAAGAPLSHFVFGLDLTSVAPAGSTPSYYHFDAIGNTVQMTGSSGTAVNSYTYLPFGERTVNAAGVSNPFTYSGSSGVLDDGFGLYQMRNRWYRPSIGRFLQQDPLGLASDPNLYRYAGNSPARYNDPTGNITAGDVYDCLNLVYSATTPFIKNQGANAIAGALGGLPTAGSLAQNAANGNIADTIHDGALLLTKNISLGLSASPEAQLNPYVFALKKVSDFAGTIDTVSQGVLYAGASLYYGGRGSFPCIPDPKPAPPPAHPNGPKLFTPPPGKSVPVQKSIDPNGKLTSGYGSNGFVPGAAPIIYTVYFENQSSATLPAQKVTVTDQLASNLDLTTVQFQNISFNNVSLSTPSDTQAYTTQATVSTDSNPVSVSATLNPSTGLLTFTLQSVDSTTGSAPANPLAGFLPPNNSANAGIGSITFSVQPKAGLANGTVITNQASIVFDVNSPIVTNSVSNTLDTASVTSAISALASSTSSPSINLSWTGSDPTGAGIAYYNIYVAVDGGSASLWLSATTLTSSTYVATPGHSYTFYSLATNNVGNTQGTPVSPQTIAVTFAAPTVSVVPASSTITATQTLGVTVALTSPNAGEGLPTGSVILSSGTYTSAAATLSSGGASFTIPAGALASGTDILTATYVPDTNASTLYTGATGTAQVTVGTPGTPGASLSPSAGLTFTSVNGTTSAAQNVQLTNTGNAALTIIGVTITGTGAAAFADTSACGTSLAAGFSCNVSVTFTPSSVASFAATLSVADNASGSPQSVSLSGTGTAPPAPIASVNTTSLSFTSTNAVASAAQTVKLSNTGNAALTISGITLTGTGASTFAQTNTCGTSIAAGSNCIISIIFTPSSVATFTASLSIADNAVGSPQTVALSGTGTAAPAPVASVTPTSLTFTSINGTASAIQTAQLSNTGNAALIISGITLTGTGASTFAQTNTCGTSVAAGANCTISVVFTPAAVAAYTASLSIADNASGSPQSVALSGTGTAIPAPIASITPATLTFTSASGVATPAQTAQLSNTGNAALTISSITLTGTGASTFAQTNTCGTSVAAGANCTISVTFTPSSVAAFTGAVSIADNATGSPQTVALTGTGTAPPTFQLSATPASQSTAAGAAVTYQIGVTPQGGAFTSPISFTASGLPSGATATFSPTTLTPGSSTASTTLRVQTLSTLAGLRDLDGSPTKPLLALAGFCFLLTRKRRQLRLLVVLLAVSLAGLVSLTGCGASSHTETYTITVTATGANQTQSTTMTLTLHD